VRELALHRDELRCSRETIRLDWSDLDLGIRANDPEGYVQSARLDAPDRFLSATGRVKVNVVPRSGFGEAQILPP